LGTTWSVAKKVTIQSKTPAPFTRSWRFFCFWLFGYCRVCCLCLCVVLSTQPTSSLLSAVGWLVGPARTCTTNLARPLQPEAPRLWGRDPHSLFHALPIIPRGCALCETEKDLSLYTLKHILLPSPRHAHIDQPYALSIYTHTHHARDPAVPCRAVLSQTVVFWSGLSRVICKFVLSFSWKTACKD